MEHVLNERYRVGPKIGDGGMAVVYRGFDTLLGRNVAIKVLREQYAADPQFLARFQREAQAVAALTHPNIVGIFDVGVEAGLHYFVMEYVDGPNLKEVIRARGALPVDEAVSIMLQVLNGLGYAHARALVHRDVKPQNILLTPDGTAKVADFGIAKGLADATLTEAGVGMGTVHYISPEQARGEPASPASDLYAAGVVLYEMLTGDLPFTADSAVGVAVQHVHDPPPAPDLVNPAVPPPLAALTVHALDKDPAARFTSAREMANALRNWPAWPVPAVRRAGAGGRAVARRGPTAVARRAAPAEPARRGGFGCVTWLVGAVIALGLVGLLLAGFRLSPFGAGLRTPTSLPALAGLPSLAPPTATATTADAPTVTATTPATATTAPVVAEPPTATTAPASPTRPTAASPTAPPTATVPPTATLTPTIALVAVPDLGGKTLAQAQQAAKAIGLAAEQAGEENSNSVPVGQVVRQDPAPGAKVPPGRTVSVIISRGPARAVVPPVLGLSYQQAVSILKNAGFGVERTDASSRTVPQGAVIDQNPAPNTTAALGSAVTVTVSLGDVVVVPGVIGMNYEEAVGTLQNAGFVVNSINGMTKAQILAQNPQFFAAYPNAQPGQVISQTLDSGTRVARGTAIGIAYYKGP
ncbi:MAG TPA: PASTA domain-containing protein [Thermomicrobiales bacterium]|nr:PASTA domain-containing protein [Thermomicrobiales bacterium]